MNGLCARKLVGAERGRACDFRLESLYLFLTLFNLILQLGVQLRKGVVFIVAVLQLRVVSRVQNLQFLVLHTLNLTSQRLVLRL